MAVPRRLSARRAPLRFTADSNCEISQAGLRIVPMNKSHFTSIMAPPPGIPMEKTMRLLTMRFVIALFLAMPLAAASVW